MNRPHFFHGDGTCVGFTWLEASFGCSARVLLVALQGL